MLRLLKIKYQEENDKSIKHYLSTQQSLIQHKSFSPFYPSGDIQKEGIKII